MYNNKQVNFCEKKGLKWKNTIGSRRMAVR